MVDSKSPSPGSAVARGAAERVPACVALQLPWAHGALRLAPARDVPAPPALPGAGTVRGWACRWHPARHSFPHLFTSSQTNPGSCFEWRLQFHRMTEGQPCLRNCLLWALPETAVWHGSWGLQRPLWETAWQFLKRLNPELAHSSAGPLWSLHPRHLQTSVHTDSQTQVLSNVVQKYSQKLETTQMSIS